MLADVAAPRFRNQDRIPFRLNLGVLHLVSEAIDRGPAEVLRGERRRVLRGAGIRAREVSTRVRTRGAAGFESGRRGKHTERSATTTQAPQTESLSAPQPRRSHRHHPTPVRYRCPTTTSHTPTPRARTPHRDTPSAPLPTIHVSHIATAFPPTITSADRHHLVRHTRP